MFNIAHKDVEVFEILLPLFFGMIQNTQGNEQMKYMMKYEIKFNF